MIRQPVAFREHARRTGVSAAEGEGDGAAASCRRWRGLGVSRPGLKRAKKLEEFMERTGRESRGWGRLGERPALVELCWWSSTGHDSSTPQGPRPASVRKRIGFVLRGRDIEKGTAGGDGSAANFGGVLVGDRAEQHGQGITPKVCGDRRCKSFVKALGLLDVRRTAIRTVALALASEPLARFKTRCSASQAERPCARYC